MSLTDRSQVFNTCKIKADIQGMSSIVLNSKPKGLSLSKQLKVDKERSHSFIKLSARTKKQNTVQKRQIKLIIKPKGQMYEPLSLNRANKENIKNLFNTKMQYRRECPGLEEFYENSKNYWQGKQRKQKKQNTNSLVTKQITVKTVKY